MTARYPLILGGDHAAFEAEWAASGRPDNERPDWPLPSFDAQDWAEAFCKRWPGVDKEVMVSWFANALMRGYDEATARSAGIRAALEMGLQLGESGKHGNGDSCPTCHFVREARKALGIT